MNVFGVCTSYVNEYGRVLCNSLISKKVIEECV